ncbi:hypothetical protein V8D89_004488 [Ganoderma adspersum]
MPECAHCHKVLKNESALLQHCKDKGHPFASALAGRPAVPVPAPSSKTSTAVPSSSTAVPASSTPLYECKPCGVSYRDKPSLDQHNASKHAPKPFSCAPCGVGFSTTDAFSIHLRNSPKHPKCPQCNSGFLDETQLKLHQARHQKCVQCGSVFVNKAQLEEHVEAAHPPAVECTCGREYAPPDQQKHYRESGNHPVCFVCGDGFLDDSTLDKHLSSAHLEARCRLCARQFRSSDELQNHYLMSLAHPHCALCEVGFADDETCDRHMSTNHPRPARVPSSPPRSPSPVPRTFPQTNFAFSLEAQGIVRSTQSSPLVQRAALAVPAVAFLTEVKSESDVDDDTYQTVEASSHVQRAISEPTVPTVSSIGPYSVQDGPEGSWRSPTLSDRSADYASYRGYALRAPSESTLSLRSAPSSLSRSLSRNSGSVVNVNVVSPRPTALPLASVIEPVPERAESLISQVVSPRFPASVHATRSVSSISERLSRAVTPSLRPSLSRQPTPRIPSPILSPARSMSRGPIGTIPVLNGTMRSRSSLASSVATDNKDDSRTDSDSEGTIPPQNLTPKPKLARLVPPAKPSASISWHCRVCLKDDCVAPMATMCGHVFCTGCIVQELVTNGSCPVCRKMLLLRLHVEVE